jgi:hypothetical protein
MKTLNMKSKLTAIVALVVIAALCAVFHTEQRAQAQDQIPPPVADRISFGMVGITAGQTMRISVADTIMPNDPNWPPGPSRVVLNFRNSNGQLVRDRNGEVIRRVVDLERGDSTFLDLNYDEFPPGPSRLQLRAVVTVIPPPIADSNEDPPPIGDRIVPTVEVINNANGRTAFVVSAPPAVQRLSPPPIGD